MMLDCSDEQDDKPPAPPVRLTSTIQAKQNHYDPINLRPLPQTPDNSESPNAFSISSKSRFNLISKSFRNSRSHNENGSPKGGPAIISAPKDFEHTVHISYDPVKGEFTGMPDNWARLLREADISKSEQKKHPEAVLNVLKWFERSNNHNKEVKFMTIAQQNKHDESIASKLAKTSSLLSDGTLTHSDGSSLNSAIDTSSTEEQWRTPNATPMDISSPRVETSRVVNQIASVHTYSHPSQQSPLVAQTSPTNSRNLQALPSTSTFRPNYSSASKVTSNRPHDNACPTVMKSQSVDETLEQRLSDTRLTDQRTKDIKRALKGPSIEGQMCNLAEECCDNTKPTIHGHIAQNMDRDHPSNETIHSAKKPSGPQVGRYLNKLAQRRAMHEDSTLSKLREVVSIGNPRERYTLIGQIGLGGSGKVMTAIDNDTGMLVAIKQMNLAQQPKREFILNEILVMREHRHPNVVNYLDSYLVDNELWVVMEYLQGGCLTDIVQCTAMEECQIATVCKEVLMALEFLHENQVIHRDIKSDNILLGIDGQVKLTDFGFCAQLAEQNKRTTMVGTPYWMGKSFSQQLRINDIFCICYRTYLLTTLFVKLAPELVKRSDTDGYGPKIDIWSLGIMAIEMIEGEPPYLVSLFPEIITLFMLKSHFKLISRMKKLNPVRALYLIETIGKPHFQRDSLSTTFQSFLDCCLEVDVEKRSTASGLLEVSCTRIYTNHQPNIVTD